MILRVEVPGETSLRRGGNHAVWSHDAMQFPDSLWWTATGASTDKQRTTSTDLSSTARALLGQTMSTAGLSAISAMMSVSTDLAMALKKG
jgi:hypothetical protein